MSPFRIIRTLRQRGFRVALTRFLAGIWSEKQWNVLKRELPQPDSEQQHLNPDAIRELTAADLDLFQELIQAWPQEMPQFPKGGLGKELHQRLNKGWWCFVILDGSEVAGALWLQPPWPALNGLETWITHHCRIVTNLFVVSRLRGRGIGVRLLDYSLRQASQRGVQDLLSLIHPDRIASLQLHAKLGFRIVGSIRHRSRFFQEQVDTFAATDVSPRPELAAQRI